MNDLPQLCCDEKQMDSGVERRVMLIKTKGKFVNNQKELEKEKCYSNTDAVHIKNKNLAKEFQKDNMKQAWINYHIPYIEKIYRGEHIETFQKLNKNFLQTTIQKNKDIDLRKHIVLPKNEKDGKKLRFTIQQLQDFLIKRLTFGGNKLDKDLQAKNQKSKIYTKFSHKSNTKIEIQQSDTMDKIKRKNERWKSH